MTVDVLVLGWSDIVRRRVLPALDGLDSVASVHLATRQGADLGGLSRKAGRTFGGPRATDDALAALPAAVVYASGVNTEHASRVHAALLSGHHVVVDKPAFLSRADASACLARARDDGLMLAEATVWSRHAQVSGLLHRMQEHGLRARRLACTFTIPSLPSTNFRTRAGEGGGAVADMGAYATSPGRVFGTSPLVGVSAAVSHRDPHGLDLGFTTTLRYEDGMTVEGAFALDGEYANTLAVEGDGWSALLSPAFSSRPDAVLDVALRVDGREIGFAAGPSDPFASFLESALAAADGGYGSEWTERTSESVADLLALAEAADVRWPGPRIGSPGVHGDEEGR